MDYDSWVAALSNLTVIESDDADFQAILPACINDAEQRIYRELDILNTVVTQTTVLSSSTRQFTLPTTSGRVVVTNFMNIITPSTATAPDDGTRNALVPVSVDVMNTLWPSSSSAGVPEMYAMLTDQNVLLGPWPSEAFTIEIGGTIRPTPLSADNTTTYLSLYLPDAFLSASMVFMSNFMRNNSATSDNPAMSTDWESHYMKEISSANIEEMRKKYASGAWGSLQPTPMATPTR